MADFAALLRAGKYTSFSLIFLSLSCMANEARNVRKAFDMADFAALLRAGKYSPSS